MRWLLVAVVLVGCGGGPPFSDDGVVEVTLYYLTASGTECEQHGSIPLKQYVSTVRPTYGWVQGKEEWCTLSEIVLGGEPYDATYDCRRISTLPAGCEQLTCGWTPPG